MSELERAEFDFAAVAARAQEARVSNSKDQEVGRKVGRKSGLSQLGVVGDKKQGHGVGDKIARLRPAEFDELVGPLEDLHPAWRLRDPGLGWCLSLFARDRDVFVSFVDYVIDAWNEKSSTKPLGLLCELVHEHFEHDPATRRCG